jgi:hypothetical protein
VKAPFEKRYVALVDVLGFKSLIARMNAEPRLFRTIRDALKVVDKQSRAFRKYRTTFNAERRARVEAGGVSFVGDMRLQMTAFSDSFVVSDTRPAWHVLAAVQALASHFLRQGILTRGGVVCGPAYHRGQVLFGPAINDAYFLETDVARYPRIVVAPDVVTATWGYHKGVCRENLLRRDTDGCWFVNVLSPALSHWEALSVPSAESDDRRFRRRIRRILIELLQKAGTNAAHRSKVAWLINHFNSLSAVDAISIDASLAEVQGN